MTDFLTQKPTLASVSASIWKALPSSHGPSMVIEARTKARKVLGFTLEMNRGKLLPFDMELEWTDTLVEVHGHVAIWQGLQDEGMPDPIGMKAVDILTGKQVWRHPDLRYLRLGPEVIVATDPSQSDILLYVSVDTGEIRHRIERQELPTDLLDRVDQNRHSVWHFPTHLTPDSEAYSQSVLTLESLTDRKIQGPISIMAAGDLEIFHAYFPDHETLNSMLVLIGPEGKSKVIPAGTYPSGYTLDPFFLYQNYLIWIQYPDIIGYLAI